MRISPQKEFRTVLMEAFELRSQRNPRYSMRAFAKFLGLTSARLSEVMNRKSGLSRQAAEKIAERLEFSRSETEVFCDLVEAEHSRSSAQREWAKARLSKLQSGRYQNLELDAFGVVADWYCFALLELTKLVGFQSDYGWIAKKLGIPEANARAAAERLERLGMLKITDGKMTPTGDYCLALKGVPSQAVQQFHRELMQKAQAALPGQDPKERECSSVVLAVDSRDISEAQAMIQNFQRDFDARFGGAAAKDRVYCLGVQFFSLTPERESGI